MRSLYSSFFSILTASAIQLSLLSSVASAQQVFTLSGLSGVPIGNYSAVKTVNDGFARPGFGAALDYTYFLDEQIDIRTSLLYTFNSFDIDSYSKLFTLYTEGENDISGGSYHSLWIVSGVTFSPFQLPVSFLVQAGVQKTAYPDNRLYGPSVPETGKRTSKFTPAFSASVLYRYKNYEAGLRAMYSRPQFISEYNLPDSPNPESFTRNITILLLYAGLVF